MEEIKQSKHLITTANRVKHLRELVAEMTKYKIKTFEQANELLKKERERLEILEHQVLTHDRQEDKKREMVNTKDGCYSSPENVSVIAIPQNSGGRHNHG